MREWERVKESIKAYLHRSDENGKENEIHGVLNLSYEDLPYYLKSCFLYMGLFKEDETVNVAQIYKKWIAQGMISSKDRDEESLMEIAELYLSELASRSIVQVEDDDCRLHDVVRELCLSMGKREGFGILSLDYHGGTLSGIKARHLAIRIERDIEQGLDRGEFSITGDEDSCKHIRSLLLSNDIVKETELLKVSIHLRVFKLLRVLHFVRIKFPGRKLPKGIGNLIHLKFLCLEECELDEVPTSIGNLSYLQTLDFINTYNVRVPDDVLKKLFHLKHLYLPRHTKDKIGSYRLELDEGLDELETLCGFDSSMHRLKSVTRMKNLRVFGARVRDNESLSEVIDAITTTWKKLWFGFVKIEQGCEFTSTEQGLMVLKKVFACPNLQQLKINIEIGRLHQCRNEVISSSLLKLYLTDCEIEDDPMEILGKLPSLKQLHLLSRSFVGKEMVCSAFSFPKLKELELNKLPMLRQWRVEHGAMPCVVEIEM